MFTYEISGFWELKHQHLPKRKTTKMITLDNAKSFWNTDCKSEGDKYGIYILCMRTRRNTYIPWYVGKTVKSFKIESLHSDKLIKFNTVLFNKIGTPHICLIPQTKGRKSPSSIDEIETLLIEHGLQRNISLLNEKKKNMVSFNPMSPNLKWKIEGVFQPGRGKVKQVVRSFKDMMQIK